MLLDEQVKELTKKYDAELRACHKEIDQLKNDFEVISQVRFETEKQLEQKSNEITHANRKKHEVQVENEALVEKNKYLEEQNR